MFIFLLQVRESLRGRASVLIGFSAFAALVWILWALKTILSRRYRPWTEPVDLAASIVIPVVDEPAEVFTTVLQRIVKQDPYEILVVINGPPNPTLERICDELAVTWVWTETPGKRNAVRLGTELATGEVIVLVDSDTLWADDMLDELVKPFADPRVGGVTTRQRIWQARGWDGPVAADAEPDDHKYVNSGFPDLRRSWRRRRRRQIIIGRFLRRWADWMEISRSLYSMPAQSALGQVGCLPGRTIAFRTEILQRAMPEFMTAPFLGVFLEVSDDRNLTNLALKEGWRTVYQSTALVHTDCPAKMGKMFRQQLRWARGSQYNTLRMYPWMVTHAPLLALFFAADILLPFLLLGTLIAWGYRAITHTGVNFLTPTIEAFPGPTGWVIAGAFIVVGSAVSMWVRQQRCLVEQPRDILWMPIYILFSSFFLMPVRLLGFLRMAHAASWGTRADSYQGERHGINPLALVPYLMAISFVALEVFLVARFS